jgi:hypothetical protein
MQRHLALVVQPYCSSMRRRFRVSRSALPLLLHFHINSDLGFVLSHSFSKTLVLVVFWMPNVTWLPSFHRTPTHDSIQTAPLSSSVPHLSLGQP